MKPPAVSGMTGNKDLHVCVERQDCIQHLVLHSDFSRLYLVTECDLVSSTDHIVKYRAEMGDSNHLGSNTHTRSCSTYTCDAPREKGTLGQNFRYWVFTGFWKSTVLGAIWCKILRNILSGSGENSILLF